MGHPIDKTPPASRRKNPKDKPLRLTRTQDYVLSRRTHEYANMLVQLAQAEATLVKAGKNSAMPHFIAIVKELERLYGFQFEVADDATE